MASAAAVDASSRAMVRHPQVPPALNVVWCFFCREVANA